MYEAGSRFIGFRIDAASGALTMVTEARAPFGDLKSLAIHPSGKFVYVVGGLINTVDAFAIDSKTGILTQLSGAPFPTQMAPTSTRVDPSGRFLYAVNFLSDTISAYTINPDTGSLTPMSGSPFSAGSVATVMAIEASGRFAYVNNYSAFAILGFGIDGNSGALTGMSGSPFFTVGNPIALTTTHVLE